MYLQNTRQMISIWKLSMKNNRFSIWKRDIISSGKAIKGLCGGDHRYAASL